MCDLHALNNKKTNKFSGSSEDLRNLIKKISNNKGLQKYHKSLTTFICSAHAPSLVNFLFVTHSLFVRTSPNFEWLHQHLRRSKR